MVYLLGDVSGIRYPYHRPAEGTVVLLLSSPERKLYLMLNVHRMSILREVAARGGIAAAAEALYMTPSAVSQHMAALEREAGTQLLERFGRGVRLTPAGEQLVAHTERVLVVLEEAEADLADVSQDVVGRLRLCAFPTAARALLAPTLTLLRARHPRLRLSMTDLEPEESIPLLKLREIDVVVTYEFDHLPVPEDPALERHVLMAEPIYLAVPASHPLAGGPVAVADLENEEWLAGREGAPFMEVTRHVAHEAGFEPKLNLQSNDYQVILACVAQGLGVTLVPPLALFAEYPGITFHVPTDVEITRREVAVIRRGSGGSPVVAAALDTLHEVANTIPRRAPTMR